MSKQQLDAFYQKMAEDKSLKDQVLALKGEINTVYAGMVKVAREAGFDITFEDIKASRIGSDKLDDLELDSVAGGCHSVCTEICGEFAGHWMGRQ